jgi:hypothetical protein
VVTSTLLLTFRGEVLCSFLSLLINVVADLWLRHTLTGVPLCMTTNLVVDPANGIAARYPSPTMIGNGPGCESRMCEFVQFIGNNDAVFKVFDTS